MSEPSESALPFVWKVRMSSSRARPAPDQHDREVDDAAVRIGRGMAEPGVTIYSALWRRARERAARTRPSRGGTVWRRLLDHQECGWEYVRPLARAVEAAERRDVEAVAPAGAMYRFTDMDIVDLYRYIAFRCADMVLAPYGSDLPSADDIDGDVDAFHRNVSLIRLASVHRLAPPEFRALADHAEGLDGWYAEFPGVFTPAAEAYYRRLGRLGLRGV